MWGGVTVKAKPGALPLDAAGIKTRLRLQDTGEAAVDSAEDALLESLVAAAVAQIDGPNGVGVAMMRQTWTLTLDAFAPVVILPGAPVIAVAEVRHMDAAGAWQVVPDTDYRLVGGTDPARLVPARGFTWPACPAGVGVVEVDYTLGAETAAEVEADLVTAVALLAGEYYENREAVVIGASVAELPLGVRHILARHVRGVVAG